MKKSFDSLLRQAPVHNRVVIICVCFTLLSMLVIGGYLVMVMYSKAYENTYEKMQIYTDKTVQNIDQSFSFITNTGLAVATGGTVGHWINNTRLFDDDSSAYYTNINNLKNETNHVLTYSNAWKTNYISYICILLNDDPLLYVSANQITPNTIYQSAVSANQILKENQEQQFIGDIPPVVDNNQIFHVRRMQRDFNSPDSLSIVIATNEKALYQDYSRYYGGEGNSTYLLDEEGYIFSSSERDQVGEKFEEDIFQEIKSGSNGNFRRDGKNYLYFSKPLSSNSLTLLNVVPEQVIIDQTLEGTPFLFVIAGILCIVLLAVGYIVSFKSTSFIKDLVICMNEVKKKNYDVKMPHYSNSAVDALGMYFNDMAAAMKTLIDDTYKAKIMRQEMELEFIQQQMNPHFLFNVLSTVQIKAKMCGDETVYQMLASLSGLLRASLYSGKSMMTSLSEEVQYAEFYLYLQKQRYQDRLDYHISMEPGLERVRIPRLTIEPIVENSVLHGMEGDIERVCVELAITKEEKCLKIRIADNGRGFDTKQLDLSGGEVSLEGTREKVGLKNTHNRLTLLYGEAYGLRIHSAPGEGTVVEIVIPLDRKGESDEV